MAERKKVSVLDLTAGQVEQIEQEIGLPINRWDEAPSMVGLYVKILALANGDDESVYRSMPVSQLVDLVTLGEEDDNP